jgi:methionine biosynthesis protein MetW
MRPDLKKIAELVEPNTRVFDIGCGTGELLEYLASNKQVDARGIELESDRVGEAVGKGLSVIQGDADVDLKNYPEKCFDYVVIGQSLQATKHPKETLEECLRIGKKVIVAAPNFGNWKNRFYLTTRGRMPVTKQLPYEWYNTPNIHFCTIKDFIELSKELGAKIEEKYFLNSAGKAKKFNGGATLANLLGDIGIFVLSK